AQPASQPGRAGLPRFPATVRTRTRRRQGGPHGRPRDDPRTRAVTLAGMTGSSGAAVAAALATPGGRPPLRGSDLPAAVTLDAGIAWADGVIEYVGPVDGLPWEPTVGQPGRGCIVPGFVDCHVHLPF